MAQELTDYITKARKRDINDEQIKKQLVDIGWPQDQVVAALAQASDLPVPPPPSISHVGMWTGFLYILFFISLYVLASSVAGMFHLWLDKVVPLTSGSATDYQNTDITSPVSFVGSYFGFDAVTIARGYLAAIFVSYPLFVILAVILKRQIIKRPMVKNLRSRKILIYITLISTFLIMLGEVITTGYNFLAGSFTDNAARHVLVTFLVAGAVFVYFFSEVKSDGDTA